MEPVPPHINKNDIPGEGLNPKELKVKVNHSLTLHCEAQAVPTPALQWYKDGQVPTPAGSGTPTSPGALDGTSFVPWFSVKNEIKILTISKSKPRIIFPHTFKSNIISPY